MPSTRKRSRLLGGEAQVGCSNLGQLAASTQARQRQRRVLTRGDDEMNGRRQVVHQKGDGLVDGRRMDQMVVVEDQQAWPRAVQPGR